MEEWLSIVKEEVDCSNTSDDARRSTKSAPPDLQIVPEQTRTGSDVKDPGLDEAESNVEGKRNICFF